MGRVRALSATGDYTFGQGVANFLVNSPAEIAQNILTRLRLLEGEWWLDVTSGTPYSTLILGKGTRPYYDQALKSRILGTTGVTAIVSYSSDLKNRTLSVSATVSTIYGPIPVVTSLSVTP